MQKSLLNNFQKTGGNELDGKKLNAEAVRKALRNKYSDHRRYAVAEEVGLTTGYPYRRLDMMVLDCFGSNGFRIDGIEIKVSTSDLRRELEDPEKHVAFFDVIDYYTLAVPAGVVEPLMDVIPKKWGILVVQENGNTRYKRRPLALEDRKYDKPVPRGFFASVTRAIQSRQPSEQELHAQYELGFKEGRDRAERKSFYMEGQVGRETEKIKKYDELNARLRLYGDNIDDIVDEFETFRKLNIDWLKTSLDNTANRLVKLRDLLDGKMQGDGENEQNQD